MRRQDRLAAARAEAAAHDGVLSRAELRGLGQDRSWVTRQVAAGRWAVHGTQTVATHTGELGVAASRWRAIWEVGVGVAVVDGVTALQVAGLTGFEEETVHVSVKHTARVTDVSGVKVHKVARRADLEVLAAGVPRTRPAVAAVRAAHWAVSDRQAALLLAMPVQQRLVSAEQLRSALRVVRGRTRRRFIRRVVCDLADGAHSLGELDFARMCRARGLPEPSRQVVRRGPRSRTYLDVRWDEAALVVEIDGSGHRTGLAVTADNLRDNEVSMAGDLVLRIDLVGLRVEAEAFMDQVCTAHRQRSAHRQGAAHQQGTAHGSR